MAKPRNVRRKTGLKSEELEESVVRTPDAIGARVLVAIMKASHINIVPLANYSRGSLTDIVSDLRCSSSGYCKGDCKAGNHR